MMTHYTSLSDIGTLLGGLAAILGLSWTVGCILAKKIAKGICKASETRIIAATTEQMQKFIASQMTDLISNRDPKSYYTLDLNFPTGESLKVPMIPGLPVQVLENILVTVTSHTKRETVATLVCKGFGHIPLHAHLAHTETVLVISGTMTCMQSGRIYREGESWEITEGEFHGAHFADCVLVIRYHPPLLTAAERPVNLTAMGDVFPA
jgi:quercetin dioxygenase-like cupin family protein